jgi:hypothetical protein
MKRKLRSPVGTIAIVFAITFAGAAFANKPVSPGGTKILLPPKNGPTSHRQPRPPHLGGTDTAFEAGT